MDSELVKYFFEKIEKLYNEKCELQAVVRHQATLLEIADRKLEEKATEEEPEATEEEPEIIEDVPSLLFPMPEKKTITVKKN